LEEERDSYIFSVADVSFSFSFSLSLELGMVLTQFTRAGEILSVEKKKEQVQKGNKFSKQPLHFFSSFFQKIITNPQ